MKIEHESPVVYTVVYTYTNNDTTSKHHFFDQQRLYFVVVLFWIIFKTWQKGNSGALSKGSFRGIRSRLASWASEHPLFPLWIATTLYYVGKITSVEEFELAGSISTAERIQLTEFEKYWSKDFAADSWHLEPSRKFKTWKTLTSVNMEFDRRSEFFIVNSWITGRFYTQLIQTARFMLAMRCILRWYLLYLHNSRVYLNLVCHMVSDQLNSSVWGFFTQLTCMHFSLFPIFARQSSKSSLLSWIRWLWTWKRTGW